MVKSEEMRVQKVMKVCVLFIYCSLEFCYALCCVSLDFVIACCEFVGLVRAW